MLSLMFITAGLDSQYVDAHEKSIPNKPKGLCTTNPRPRTESSPSRIGLALSNTLVLRSQVLLRCLGLFAN